MRYRYDLHEYQERAIQFIMDTKRCALWLDMGLGKTTSTLTAISDLKDSFAVDKVLVIAPLRVANTVWKQEAAQWHHLKHLDIAICTGTERNRISVLQRDADVYVINRENVEWLVNHYKKKWPFDCVVIDESSSFKNATSKRFKALKKILPMTEYMVLLTGTPSPNGLLDLWPQTYLIDQGEALGRTMTAFKQRYFETDYMGYKHTPRTGSPERIYELLAPMTISMSAEDYLELPDRIDLIESVELAPAALKAYQLFEDTLLAQLPDGEMVEAMNAAVLANKLLQNANGALYTDTLGNWTEVHSAKLDALVDLVEQNSGENLLVAYNYKSDLERIQKKFPYARMLDKDPQTVVDWNAGRIKMLLAHPACLHPSTEVLTEGRGWVRIIDVNPDERVFDGLEFVNHSGCSFSGIKTVTELFGVTMTPDHKLLIGGEWIEAKNVRNIESSRREARYSYAGDDSYLSAMLPLRERGRYPGAKPKTRKPSTAETLRQMYRPNFSQTDRNSNLENLEWDDTEGNSRIRGQFRELRRSRNWCFRGLARLQKVLSRYVTDLQGSFDIGSYRQLKRLLQGKLPLGYKYAAAVEQAEQPRSQLPWAADAFGRVLPHGWSQPRRNNTTAGQRDEWGASTPRLSGFGIPKGPKVSKVYDLVDCGPRHRFLIRNSDGEVFISHNSAGHGLNLQRGGSMIIWFSLNWSLELYQQFNARLHRQGQDKPVRIVHMVVNKTIDERVMSVLASKNRSQAALLNALKPKGK